jgi:NADPH:quinone reductase-like Zn-dependent oxidoreductase
MKAAVCDRPGGPNVIRVAEVDEPELAPDAVLVRVRASSVNPVDLFSLSAAAHWGRWLQARGRPRLKIMGNDFAGTVVAVGHAVTSFRVGDEVFGAASGAWADQLCVPAGGGIVPMPSSVTFEAAAAVPVAGLTALQAVRDQGRIQPRQRVLVNGASGGVGTLALQIAKALGGEVTAVCSPAKVEVARALGADHVIDYTREDFTASGRRYDLIIDIAGSRPWSSCVRVLEPRGTLVITGASAHMHSQWRSLGHIAATRLAAVPSGRRAAFFIAQVTKANLEMLGAMLADGRIQPVIETRYRLGDVGAACDRLAEGHAAGKIVVEVGSPHDRMVAAPALVQAAG